MSGLCAITSARLGMAFTGATFEEAYAKLRAASYATAAPGVEAAWPLKGSALAPAPDRGHPIFGSGYTADEADDAARDFLAWTQ